MNERTTVQILKNSLEYFYEDGWYHKPQDIPGTVCFYDNKTGRYVPMRFAKENPFDILFFWKNELVAIEAKFVKDKKPFIFTSVSENQIANLKRVSRNEGTSYIAIHMFSTEINKIALVEINDYLHWMDTWERKSIRWDEIIRDSHVSMLKDVTKLHINLRSLIMFGDK